MESVQPYQRHLGARFTGMLRTVLEEGYDNGRFSRSSSITEYLGCFVNMHLIPVPADRDVVTPEVLSEMFYAQARILGRVIAKWEARRNPKEPGVFPPTLAAYIEFIRHGTSKIDYELGRYAFEEVQPPLTERRKKAICFEIGTHLPGLLLDAMGSTLGKELEATIARQRIDPDLAFVAFDELLQDGCRQVQQGKTFGRMPHDPMGELFAVSMNSLTKQYHPSKGMLSRTLPWLYFWRKNSADPSYYRDGRSADIEQFYTEVGVELGFSEAEVLAVYKGHRYGATIRKLQQRRAKGPEEFDRERVMVGMQITRMRLARRLVDGIASGAISYSHVVRLARQLASQPLAQRANPERRIPQRSVWQRVTMGCDSHSAQDAGRIAQLERYAKEWSDAHVFYSEDTDLGAKYFIAVFPETLPDGTVLEHALADHPAVGHHAIYAWRGEFGLTMAGEMAITWRDIFSLRRRLVIRAMGAMRIFHSGDYHAKIEEFLTSPTPHQYRL